MPAGSIQNRLPRTVPISIPAREPSHFDRQPALLIAQRCAHEVERCHEQEERFSAEVEAPFDRQNPEYATRSDPRFPLLREVP